MFWIEMNFPAESNAWTILPGEYPSRADANMEITRWRNKYGSLVRNPFRVIEAPKEK